MCSHSLFFRQALCGKASGGLAMPCAGPLRSSSPGFGSSHLTLYRVQILTTGPKEDRQELQARRTLCQRLVAEVEDRLDSVKDLKLWQLGLACFSHVFTCFHHLDSRLDLFGRSLRAAKATWTVARIHEGGLGRSERLVSAFNDSQRG